MPFWDDLSFTPVGPHQGFAYKARGRISYVTVVGDAGTLGYLWYSDSEGAAGMVPRPAAGDAADNAAVLWVDRIKEQWREGCSPSQAVATVLKNTSGKHTGQAVPESTSQAESLDELKELARDPQS